MARLTDKVALITGGASGLGKAISTLFVKEGATVFIADINTLQGEACCAEIGEGAFFIELDVTKEDSWQNCFEHILSQTDQLDILVNNAGILEFGNIEEASLQQWERVQKVNGTGTFLGCKYGVTNMKEHTKSGSIINVSSAASLKTGSGLASYSASKAVSHNLTWSVALHCAEQGYPIRCNSLHPGVIDTPMIRGENETEESAKEVVDQFVAVHPLGRVANTSEISKAVLFLASDEVPFMTGAPLVVDGGFTIA